MRIRVFAALSGCSALGAVFVSPTRALLTILTLACGVFLGGLVGYAKQRVGGSIRRVGTLGLGLPGILWLVARTRCPESIGVQCVLGALFIAVEAMMSLGEPASQIAGRGFPLQARALGASPWKQLLHHVLPVLVISSGGRLARLALWPSLVAFSLLPSGSAPAGTPAASLATQAGLLCVSLMFLGAAARAHWRQVASAEALPSAARDG